MNRHRQNTVSILFIECLCLLFILSACKSSNKSKISRDIPNAKITRTKSQPEEKKEPVVPTPAKSNPGGEGEASPFPAEDSSDPAKAKEGQSLTADWFYEITHSESGKTSYLFGSMHFGEGLEKLAQRYESKIKLSELFFMEADQTAIDKTFEISPANTKGLKRLKTNCEECFNGMVPLYKKAMETIGGTVPSDDEILQILENHLRPLDGEAVVKQYLMQLILDEAALKDWGGFDKAFKVLAKKNGVPIDYLDDEETLVVLNIQCEESGDTEKMIEHQMKQILSDGFVDNFVEHFNKTVEAYKKNQSQEILKLDKESLFSYEPSCKENLILKRNQNWIDKIVPLLEKERKLFAVVGLYHLIGEGNIIDAIQAVDGLKVKKYNSKTHSP